MRQIVLSLAAATGLFATHSLAMASETPWENLLGCYKSVSLNGSPIKPGPDLTRSLTRITKDDSTDYTNLDGTQIPSIRMRIFVGCDLHMPGYYFFEESAFLGMGSFGSDNSALTYQYEGRLLSPPWGNKETNLFAHLEVTSLPNQQLQIHAIRKSSLSGEKYDQDNIFILSPTACPGGD